MPQPPFLNPDPVAYLVGHSNKAPVVVDGQEVTALIDLGTQVSSISAQFCKDLILQIQPLGQLLELEGTGGAAIPDLRFVQVNLHILGIRNYNEDVLLQDGFSHGGYKDNQQSSEPHDYGGACKSHHDVETGSLWSSHVRVTATLP